MIFGAGSIRGWVIFGAGSINKLMGFSWSVQGQSTFTLQQQWTISRKRGHSSSSYFSLCHSQTMLQTGESGIFLFSPKVVTFLHYTKSMSGNYTVHSISQCQTAWVGEERRSTAIQTPFGTGQSAFPSWNGFRMRFGNPGGSSALEESCQLVLESNIQLLKLLLFV